MSKARDAAEKEKQRGRLELDTWGKKKEEFSGKYGDMFLAEHVCEEQPVILTGY